MKDLLELNLDLPYVLPVSSVIRAHWHTFVNEVAVHLKKLDSERERERE